MRAELERFKMDLEKKQQQQIMDEKIQEVKSDAIKIAMEIAREKFDAERRAEEELQRVRAEAREQGLREARERFEAEQKAEKEQKQREEDARARVLQEEAGLRAREEAAKRMLEIEAEEGRRRFHAEEEQRRQGPDELQRKWWFKMAPSMLPERKFGWSGFRETATTDEERADFPPQRSEASFDPRNDRQGYGSRQAGDTIHQAAQWRPHTATRPPSSPRYIPRRHVDSDPGHNETGYFPSHDRKQRRQDFDRRGDFRMHAPSPRESVSVPPHAPPPPTSDNYESASDQGTGSDVGTDPGTATPRTSYRRRSAPTEARTENEPLSLSPSSGIASRGGDSGYDSSLVEDSSEDTTILEHLDEGAQSEEETVIELESLLRKRVDTPTPQESERGDVSLEAPLGRDVIHHPEPQSSPETPRLAHEAGTLHVVNQPNYAHSGSTGPGIDTSLPPWRDKSDNPVRPDPFDYMTEKDRSPDYVPSGLMSSTSPIPPRSHQFRELQDGLPDARYHRRPRQYREHQEYRGVPDHRPAVVEGWPPPVRRHAANPRERPPAHHQYPVERHPMSPYHGSDGQRASYRDYDEGSDLDSAPIFNMAQGTVPCVILPLSFFQRRVEPQAVSFGRGFASPGDESLGLR